MQQRIEDHERLYAALRTMSEQDSRAVLDKLRLGADVSTVLRQIKEGDLLLQLSLVPESRRRYEFPYSSTMPPICRPPTTTIYVLPSTASPSTTDLSPDRAHLSSPTTDSATIAGCMCSHITLPQSSMIVSPRSNCLAGPQ